MVNNDLICANLEFLNKGKYTWHKKRLDAMFKVLKDFEGTAEGQERCYEMFMFEIEQARSNFLREINDLRLIMSCRVKGDCDSNFGGLTCEKLAKEIKISAKKYLISTEISDVKNANSIAFVIKEIMMKAKNDEEYARKFETEAKNTYENLGVDNSLEIFKNAGYMVSF